MKRLLLLAACTALVVSAQQAPHTHLKVGDTAPDFKLRGSQGKEVTLSEFKGKKMVILAFFPAAFTGG